MAESNNTCKSCRYWHDQQIIGLCRRYPKSEHKHSHEWCGEFSGESVVVEIKPKRKYTRRQDDQTAA